MPSGTPESVLSFPPPASLDPFDHPDALYDELRRTSPVRRIVLPDLTPAFLVTGYEEVRRVLVDPRFSRAAAAAPDTGKLVPGRIVDESLLGLDPPDHTRIRRLVARAFTHHQVERLRPGIRAIIAELLDTVAGRTSADLMAVLAVPLPVRVICLMLGVPPEDDERFRAWSNALVSSMDGDMDLVARAGAELDGYLHGLLAAKRAAPGADLMSALHLAQEGDDQLTDKEIVNLASILLVAGNETTTSQLGLYILELTRRPDLADRLRADPALLPAAVEELLRLQPLSTIGGALPRIALEDIELAGTVIPAGSVVLPATESANHDPAVFTDPHTLDIGRADNRHLSFGNGAHHCLGAQLARLELREALGAVLDRLPGFRLAVPVGEVRLRANSLIRCPDALPLEWDA
ncbi:cytochrome P450 [Longispora sp. NPDC051575]|uniref:cytochrome P450 n=1 Tax=Longispora sp. NPDC051575 TaxID=3154943 RepID=UPI0034316C40